MKAYITFVLVILILASLISMDVLLNSIGREKSPILTQEKMFYSNIENNQRIEEAAMAGSAIGISLYVKYKEAELAVEALETGGTAVPADVAKSIDLKEMENWSDAGVLIGLASLNNNNDIGGHGFYCTWATDAEIKDNLNYIASNGVLTLPVKTKSLNLENCPMLPHSQISFTENAEDLPIDEMEKGNLSALNVSVVLYDEEKPGNGFRKGRVASVYYDKESNTASIVTFPETRRIDAPYMSETVMTKTITNQFTSFFNVLYDQYGIITNETISIKLINGSLQ
ncbi:MAG: hypothetical protein NTY68_03465 [Candidatus Micrarchaeota archaeon]|nr:hypothetical protein [Candidatus Micrarchaeota archaeon]